MLFPNPFLSAAVLKAVALAQTPPPPPAENFQVLGQTTFIEQNLFKFHSPYTGSMSLQDKAEGRATDSYTLYMGARGSPGLEAYFDPEAVFGGGISQALGVSDFTNGEVVRNPELGIGPYVARAFLRWTLPLGSGRQAVARGENQLAGPQPTDRVVVTGGKLSTVDIFDQNRYADSPRTQFMGWSLMNNAAYDYAADTRGYTEGVAVEMIHPRWAFRVGAFAMPRVANGPDLDPKLTDSLGTQAELELHPNWSRRYSGGVVRLLGYRNMATMGSYAASIALGQATSTVPDITATRQRGRVKYGFGLNLEQPISDDGDTGLFARLGWNDGANETFVYTEADDVVSLGAQFSGKRWHAPNDLFAIAVNDAGLSVGHREYLMAGGSGFLLGDGKLNYGRETGIEAYYTRKIAPGTWQLTLDGQLIIDPGYNKDRGPIPVLSFRIHAEF